MPEQPEPERVEQPGKARQPTERQPTPAHAPEVTQPRRAPSIDGAIADFVDSLREADDDRERDDWRDRDDDRDRDDRRDRDDDRD